ncbi:MAG: transcriptional regulator, AraC family [Akkermansiaceae bacterium]|nr:transcriptional regulator, AraC family [Akkermansiaceae bacterium]
MMLVSGNARFQRVKPRPPLSDFVAGLWLFSGYQAAHEFEHLLPSGKVILVINLEELPVKCYEPGTLAVQQTLRGPVLCGVHDVFEVVDTHAQREVMGVEFLPGGAPAFFDLPLDEMRGTDLPLEALWGPAADELHDRLLHASSGTRRLAILEQALLGRLRENARVHPVIAKAAAQLDRGGEPVEIAALAAAVGWSDRYFIKTFSEQVGITPKVFGRIRRFQGALRRMKRDRECSWTELALDCGYYDQAHFIREFKALAGMTPGAYRRLPVQDVNHVPLLLPVG